MQKQVWNKLCKQHTAADIKLKSVEQPLLVQKVVTERKPLDRALSCVYLGSHESTSVQHDHHKELAAYLPTTNQISTRTTSASQLFVVEDLTQKHRRLCPWSYDGYRYPTNVTELRRLI